MIIAGLFLLGILLLYLGGEGLVRGAAAIGMRAKLSPLVVGLTLVAFATSAPELAISVGAALRDLPGLAVGNVVGSNICNLALIMGLVALVMPAPVAETIRHRDLIVMLVATFVVPIMFIDNELGRLEGIVLLLAIAAYIGVTVRVARDSHDEEADASSVPTFSKSLTINLLLCAGSVTMLYYGSEFLVDASVSIAQAIGVSPAIVGLSAAALGTSLPELTASLISARHGHPEMAAGNLIGSNIFNLLLILGVTSTVRPLSSMSVTLVDLALMIVITLLSVLFMLTRAQVGRQEGGVLVAVYLLYIGWLYLQ